MQDVDETPAEPSSPIVTMGKREEAYDEPPPKRQYTKARNLSTGKKDPICGICLSGPEKNKKGKILVCGIFRWLRYERSGKCFLTHCWDPIK